jgi:hypothetical protein
MARNPLRDGWRVLMRAPESILAEIAWRWALGIAFWGLLILSFHQYFSQIEIGRAEYALMKSLEPFTWLAIGVRVTQAFVAGLRDMGPILIPALSLLWLALATVGRGVTVRALSREPMRINWWSLARLNALRLLMTFAALLAYLGAAIVVSHTLDPRQYYVLNVVLLLFVMALLLAIWGAVNWFVSLAQIFAAQAGDGLMSSFRRATTLYQAYTGEFLSSGIWFFVTRLILIGLVTLGSLSPLGKMSVAGVKGWLVFVAILSLLYFAAADALNMWRLGVYISLTEPEPAKLVSELIPPPHPVIQPGTGSEDAYEPTPSSDQGVPPGVDEWKPIAEN